MTARLHAMILVSLVVVGLGFSYIAHAQTPGDSDRAAVMALNQRLLAGYSNRDAGAIAACYSNDPKMVLFEDTIPLQLDKATLIKPLGPFFKTTSAYDAKMESYDVVISGDLAAVHYIVQSNWTDQNGKHSQTSRYTQIDRKEGGKWLIWHDHFSVPFDPATGKAVLDATP